MGLHILTSYPLQCFAIAVMYVLGTYLMNVCFDARRLGYHYVAFAATAASIGVFTIAVGQTIYFTLQLAQNLPR